LRRVAAMEVEPERATDGRTARLPHVDVAYPVFGGDGVLDDAKLALLLRPAREEAVDPNLLVWRVARGERESVGGLLFSFVFVVVAVERVSEEAADAASATSADDAAAATTGIIGGQGVSEEGYDGNRGEEIIIYPPLPTSRRFGMIAALHVGYRGRGYGENMIRISVQLQSTAHV
jgi:hypothetical protein